MQLATLGRIEMFNDIGNLIQKLERESALKPLDLSLSQALAALYLAREISGLKASIDRVTEASDFIPGGYAIRTHSVK
jgi:hypothetical protein